MNYEDFWKLIRLECYPFLSEAETVELMTNGLARTGFGIKINFGSNSSPSQIFRALSEMVNSFQQIDKHLLESINVEIEPLILLEDIEQGSIIVWLKNVLKDKLRDALSTPVVTNTLTKVKDEDIEDLNFKKVVGVFLNQSRYAIIDFTRKEKNLENKEELKILQQSIANIAEETGVKDIQIYSQASQAELLDVTSYSPINSKTLLDDISNLQKSLSILGEEDQASYLTSETEVFFNKDFNFSSEVIESLLTSEVIENESVIILQIKKMDLLGDSKWEFKHENKTLSMKISDLLWLSSYKNGEIDIRPKTSLKAKVKTVTKYDEDSEVVSTQYEITKVLEVIKPQRNIQKSLIIDPPKPIEDN